MDDPMGEIVLNVSFTDQSPMRLFDVLPGQSGAGAAPGTESVQQFTLKDFMMTQSFPMGNLEDLAAAGDAFFSPSPG